MSLLNIAAHYPKVPSTALIILGPLRGLTYVTVVTMTGAVIIVVLILYQTGQLLRRALRQNFSDRL